MSEVGSNNRIGLPFQPHSETSRAAARSMARKTSRVRGDRQRILDVLMAKPLTDREMQEILKLDGSTQRPRRIELMNDGLVADTGERRNGSVLWWLTRMMPGFDDAA